MQTYKIFGVDGDIYYGACWDSSYHGMRCWANDSKSDIPEGLEKYVRFPDDTTFPRDNSQKMSAAWAEVDETINTLINQVKESMK